MEEISAAILNKLPHAEVHRCASIEKIGDKGILELGEIIAAEIKFKLQRYIDADKLECITLIGHSRGGLVVRAALPHLEEYSKYFHGLVTFATPHYGYIHSKSKLLSIGMWAVSRFTKDPTVGEMRLSDKSNIEECALYVLSNAKGLEWFKHVLLVGSSHDTYSPLESALIQFSERFSENSNIKTICDNIQKKLKASKVTRVNVNFKFADSSIDTYIGRMGHIQFVENSELLKMIITRYDKIFVETLSKKENRKCITLRKH